MLSMPGGMFEILDTERWLISVLRMATTSSFAASGRIETKDLAPTMSALIIIAHVKEGVDLARDKKGKLQRKQKLA